LASISNPIKSPLTRSGYQTKQSVGNLVFVGSAHDWPVSCPNVV